MTMQEEFEKWTLSKKMFLNPDGQFCVSMQDVKAWLPRAEKVSNAKAQRDMLERVHFKCAEQHDQIHSACRTGSIIQAEIDKLNKVIGGK